MLWESVRYHVTVPLFPLEYRESHNCREQNFKLYPCLVEVKCWRFRCDLEIVHSARSSGKIKPVFGKRYVRVFGDLSRQFMHSTYTSCDGKETIRVTEPVLFTIWQLHKNFLKRIQDMIERHARGQLQRVQHDIKDIFHVFRYMNVQKLTKFGTYYNLLRPQWQSTCLPLSILFIKIFWPEIVDILL